MDFLPAIQLIEKAKHIGLILPLHPNHDILASAEVLARFLSGRRIYTGLITPSSTHSLSADTTFSSLLSLKPLTREFIISLNTADTPISQLRYENTKTQIDIILSPSIYSTLQDRVSFREGRTQCDCIITIGIDDIKTIAVGLSLTDQSLLSETPIIALAITKTHKQYGQINLVDLSLVSITELVYRLLGAFPDHTIANDSATLLLSGILHRTNNFAVLANADTLLSSHELIRLGAHYEAAHSLSHSHVPPSLMPLVGRALARSRIDDDRSIAWSLLTADDFIATRCTPQDIHFILDCIKKEFFDTRISVLLWHDQVTSHIRASIAADTTTQEAICRSANAELKHTENARGAHLELSDTYDSFPEAEKTIAALIDSTL